MEGVLFFRSLPVVSPTLIDINIVITIDVTYYNLRSFHLLQNAAKQCIITFSYNTKQKNTLLESLIQLSELFLTLLGYLKRP